MKEFPISHSWALMKIMQGRETDLMGTVTKFKPRSSTGIGGGLN